MPYSGQFAAKGGHIDLIKNKDVTDFISECDYLQMPSEGDTKKFCEHFIDIPVSEITSSSVISIDGSKYESSIDNNFPNTMVGYIKVSMVLIDINKYNELFINSSRYVDPFKVSELQNNNDSLSFSVPSSNMRLKGYSSVKDSFRKRLYDIFISQNTELGEGRNLLKTLYVLEGNNNNIQLERCPSCKFKSNVELKIPEIKIKDSFVNCPNPDCKAPIYATDILRLHEEVSEFGSNDSVMTRVMNILEHLLFAHYICYLSEKSPETLSKTTFFIDGPLAIFGPAAKFHKRIMALIYQINKKLEDRNLPKFLTIGLQKTGQVVDFANSIKRILDKNFENEEKIFLIDDAFRYKYIKQSLENNTGFGIETYYGQDFIFKTKRGRQYIMSLPYTFETKESNNYEFHKEKLKYENYPDLGKCLSIIKKFECDMFTNAVVPITMAHRHASISLVPGGKVLDILSAREFNRR
jgi:hypothetical protein